MSHKVCSIENLKKTLSIIPFLIVAMLFPVLAACAAADQVAILNGLMPNTVGAGFMRLCFAIVFLLITFFFMRKHTHFFKVK